MSEAFRSTQSPLLYAGTFPPALSAPGGFRGGGTIEQIRCLFPSLAASPVQLHCLTVEHFYVRSSNQSSPSPSCQVKESGLLEIMVELGQLPYLPYPRTLSRSGSTVKLVRIGVRRIQDTYQPWFCGYTLELLSIWLWGIGRNI